MNAEAAAQPAQRRARVTLRCLGDDLQLEVPGIEIDISTLDHPLIAEAVRVAPTAPSGQKRILSIDKPPVYALRHSRWRGASWIARGQGLFWLCAGETREEGSREDAYAHFERLHKRGRLLPTTADYQRDGAERVARTLLAAREEASRVLSKARSTPATDVPFSIAGQIDGRVQVQEIPGLCETWVGLNRLDNYENEVQEELRDLLFIVFEDVAGAQDMELRGDWADGSPATWLEIVKLAIRED